MKRNTMRKITKFIVAAVCIIACMYLIGAPRTTPAVENVLQIPQYAPILIAPNPAYPIPGPIAGLIYGAVSAPGDSTPDNRVWETPQASKSAVQPQKNVSTNHRLVVMSWTIALFNGTSHVPTKTIPGFCSREAAVYYASRTFLPKSWTIFADPYTPCFHMLGTGIGTVD